MLISITNILFLVLWVGIWQKISRDTFFNPYIAAISSLNRRVTNFIQPVLPWFNEHLRATAALLFMLVFRGFLIFHTKDTLEVAIQNESPAGALFSVVYNADSIMQCQAYSFLSFAWIIFSISVLGLLYRLLYRDAKQYQLIQALGSLSAPGADASPAFRGIQIFIAGCLLVYISAALGTAEGVVYPGTTAANYTPRLLLASVAMIVNSLNTLFYILIGAIILSFAGAFTQRRVLMKMGHDIVTFLLGPLRKWRLVVGTFDLSPLIFFVGLSIAQGTLFYIILMLSAKLK